MSIFIILSIWKRSKISHQIICELENNKYTIKHYYNNNRGSSGGPLINSNNNKVIAIHRGTPEDNNKQYNIGSFQKGEKKLNQRKIIFYNFIYYNL